MNRILGTAKSIRELLKGSKYTVDYYQREYSWQPKQVKELIDDLTGKFGEDFDPDHERSKVETYGHYFLGSIIVSEKEGQRFIIDGQQRLTTLTLLLMSLRKLQRDSSSKVDIDELIFSQRYGKMSFNLDVPERNACMEALFKDEPFEPSGRSESIANIVGRCEDIDAAFPSSIDESALPYFIDWLIENVHMVEITAFSDNDAYTIFETMNDRGLSLTPTDMLKGYLLANIDDGQKRAVANTRWKLHVSDLQKLGKEEDADCIKAWLRGQHAQTIRERKRNAVAEDFDKIGTEFHRWVKDHGEELGLKDSAAFSRFIESEFDFYAKEYLRIRRAAEFHDSKLSSIYFNAQNNFTLQYPLMLAALKQSDQEDEILRKLNLVSNFVEILIARRVWNFKSIDYNTMNYAMFLVMKDIRRKTSIEISSILQSRLMSEGYDFSTRSDFYLTGSNRRQVHRLLARMTEYIEVQSGHPSHFADYVAKSTKNPFEVEHIWADHFDRHKDEFAHANEFASHRNRVGGLLLLPKSFNSSYGDLTYEKKLPHYFGQNLLAQTLHPDTYKHNPGFLRFCQTSGLPFKAQEEFKKFHIEERQKLFIQLAQTVWNPTQLAAIADEASS